MDRDAQEGKAENKPYNYTEDPQVAPDATYGYLCQFLCCKLFSTYN